MRTLCFGSKNLRHGFESKLIKYKLRKYKWKDLAGGFDKKNKETTLRYLQMENAYRRGVKRKWEGDRAEDYVKQRSIMYELFYKKFHTKAPDGKEIPLRRSILLRESIRSIEQELFEEGLMRSQQAAEATIDAPMAQLTLDPLPDGFAFPMAASPLPTFTEVPQGMESDHGDFVTLASSLVDSLTESGIVDLLPSPSVIVSQEEPVTQSALLSSSSAPLYCNLQARAGAASSSPVFSGSYMYSAQTSVESTVLQSVDVPSLPASAYDGVAMDITPSLPPFSSWASSLLTHELPKEMEEGDTNNNSSNNSPTLGPYNYFDNFGSGVVSEESGSTAEWGDFSEQDFLDLLQTCQQKQEVFCGTDSAAIPPPASSSSPSPNTGLGGQCAAFCRSDSAIDELDSIMQVIVGN